MADEADTTRSWPPEDAANHLRRMLENAPLVLWAMDRDGVLTLSEGHALHALGLDSGQVVGESVFVLYRDLPDVVANLKRALAGEEFTAHVELGEVIFETHHYPQYDSAGDFTGVLGISYDITDRIRAQREREAMQEQLLQAQKLEGLGLMAGGIAHDFNNILTGILGSATTAKAALSEGHAAHHDLDGVILAARRAGDLTRQMLAYSGRAHFEIHPTDVSVMAREIVTLVEASAPKKVQIQLELEVGLPAVAADATQLQQVLMNLAINGAEAIGDAEGTVQITTGSHRMEAAQAAALKPTGDVEPGDFVFIEVRDSGCGMDEETVARIFDPFYSTKFAGRGLGLAAVLGIVRAHGGALEVSSTPGRGSTFRLYLPASSGVVAAARPEGGDYRGDGRVLIVDDDEGVRGVARRMFAYMGFDVIEASDGHEGLEVFGRHSEELALVLLDLTMPRLGGDEVFQQMRQVRGDIPILLTSGFTELEATEGLSASELAGFVQKPFSLADLRDKVSAVLGDAQGSPA